MNKAIKLSIIIVGLLAASCSQNEEVSELDAKKGQLAEYNQELAELESKIKALEREIAQEDPAFVKALNPYTLVSSEPVAKKKFVHEIEARAIVESRRNIVVSSEAMGRITSIRIKEGDKVAKGQVLFTIDAEILKNNIQELETSLELAKIVYERQENLWKNNIGTEIQYLQAKNNYESLERKLETANSQLAKSTIRAPFSGNVDEVFVKEGEMAQMGGPMVRIVSLQDMYLRADISEAHIGKFEIGDVVKVEFPALNKQFESTISAVGQVIEPANRTYSLEIKLSNNDPLIKPNLTAVISLTDYVNQEALVIPTEVIQKDNQGDYVYVLEKKGEESIASRVHITLGKTYQNESEVIAGLSGEHVIITEGFREVTDGMMVTDVNTNL